MILEGESLFNDATRSAIALPFFFSCSRSLLRAGLGNLIAFGKAQSQDLHPQHADSSTGLQ